MIPTLVISLKEDTKRRTDLIAHLKECDIDFEFLDATDGRKMDVSTFPAYNRARRISTCGRDLTPGEIGCILSHRAAYQHIIDNDLDHLLLLEDDVRLDKNTKATVEHFIDKKIDYEILRLLGSPKVARGRHRKITPLYKDINLVRLLNIHGGTQATLISKKGAQKLLDATEYFAFPIDIIMCRTWETGINSLAFMPGLATQDLAYDSTIGDMRQDKTIDLEGFAKIKYKFTRLLFKCAEAIGKRYTYISKASADLAITKKFR